MGEALPHGKPFLGDGEVLPIFGPDAPGHPSRDFEGEQPRLLPDHLEALLQPVCMVPQQRVHTGMEISGGPVGGQGRFYVILPHLLQTAQVTAQGIFQIGPAGDVGGDVEQHMVAGKHDLLLRHPQAQVAGRVARGTEDLQAIAPHLQHIPRRQAGIAIKARVRRKTPAWVRLRGNPEHLRRDAGHGEARVFLTLQFKTRAPHDPVPVQVVDEDTAGRGGHLRQQAGVVRVEVGQKNIGILHAYVQLPQPVEERPAAGLLPEARVDQQAAVLPADQIAVELTKGVVGQRDGDAVDVAHDFTRHDLRLLSFFDFGSPLYNCKRYANFIIGGRRFHLCFGSLAWILA